MKIKTVNSKRIIFYDNLKFLLILFVVVGHLAGCNTTQIKMFRSVYLFVYAFHMPMFLFIAGLFHRNENVVSKAVSYFAIGFLMKIFLFIEKSVLNGEMSVFCLLEDADIPWFMFVLGMFLLITYLLRDIKPSFLVGGGVVLACFVGYDNSIGDYLYLSRAIVFYPYYMLGTMLNPIDLTEATSKKCLQIVSIIIVGIWGAVCLFCVDDIYALRGLFTARNSFSYNELFVKYGALYRLLCYIIATLIGTAFICLTPKKKMPIVTKCGSKSMQIYFWHWLIILIVIRTGIGKVFENTREGQILWLLSSILIVCVLSLDPLAFPTKNVIDVCKSKY